MGFPEKDHRNHSLIPEKENGHFRRKMRSLWEVCAPAALPEAWLAREVAKLPALAACETCLGHGIYFFNCFFRCLLYFFFMWFNQSFFKMVFKGDFQSSLCRGEFPPWLYVFTEISCGSVKLYSCHYCHLCSQMIC